MFYGYHQQVCAGRTRSIRATGVGIFADSAEYRLVKVCMQGHRIAHYWQKLQGKYLGYNRYCLSKMRACIQKWFPDTGQDRTKVEVNLGSIKTFISEAYRNSMKNREAMKWGQKAPSLQNLAGIGSGLQFPGQKYSLNQDQVHILLLHRIRLLSASGSAQNNHRPCIEENIGP